MKFNTCAIRAVGASKVPRDSILAPKWLATAARIVPNSVAGVDVKITRVLKRMYRNAIPVRACWFRIAVRSKPTPDTENPGAVARRGRSEWPRGAFV